MSIKSVRSGAWPDWGTLGSLSGPRTPTASQPCLPKSLGLVWCHLSTREPNLGWGRPSTCSRPLGAKTGCWQSYPGLVCLPGDGPGAWSQTLGRVHESRFSM